MKETEFHDACDYQMMLTLYHEAKYDTTEKDNMFDLQNEREKLLEEFSKGNLLIENPTQDL